MERQQQCHGELREHSRTPDVSGADGGQQSAERGDEANERDRHGRVHRVLARGFASSDEREQHEHDAEERGNERGDARSACGEVAPNAEHDEEKADETCGCWHNWVRRAKRATVHLTLYPMRPLPLLFVAIVAIPVLAQTPVAPPRPAETEEYAKFLERDQRAGRLQVDRVVSTLALQPGQKIADLGSGSGLFTRPLARVVGPAGVVYAIDVDEGLLRVVDRTAKDQGLTNIHIVRAEEKEPKIPEPVDLIFICDTLHHLPKPQADYLKTLRKHLRPGGRVAIIDFAKNWPAGHEALRYEPADAEAWMKDAGFTREASYDFIEDNFFYIYKLGT